LVALDQLFNDFFRDGVQGRNLFIDDIYMKKILIAVILVLISAVSIGIYLFNLKPTDTRQVDAKFELEGSQLIAEFSEDETIASKKYVDHIIIVSGKVAEVKFTGTEASVSLQSDDPMSGITCSFYADEANTLTTLSSGDDIKIKGKCTGKLMDVVLNNCSLVK
jgi:uncharacterized protein YxeA